MKYSRNLNSMIMSAMKAGEKVKSEVYKSIKAEFLKCVTAKGAKITNINDLPDEEEVRIINKMVKERTESAEVYNSNGRADLAETELIESEFLKELLPKAATQEEIREAILEYVLENGEFDKKQMGLVMKYLKNKFENVDGKLASQLINLYLETEYKD